MGVTISATTTPQMNVDDVKSVALVPESGSLGSAPSTEKIGIQPNHVAIQRERLVIQP